MFFQNWAHQCVWTRSLRHSLQDQWSGTQSTMRNPVGAETSWIIGDGMSRIKQCQAYFLDLTRIQTMYHGVSPCPALQQLWQALGSAWHFERHAPCVTDSPRADSASIESRGLCLCVACLALLQSPATTTYNHTKRSKLLAGVKRKTKSNNRVRKTKRHTKSKNNPRGKSTTVKTC